MTGRWKRYPAYRASGVDWIDEVPRHWDTRRLRFLARFNPPGSSAVGFEAATEVSFVPMEAVGEWGGLDLAATKRIEEVGAGYTWFQDGDVVVAKITPCFENGKGALAAGLTNGGAFGTTELHVVRPSRSLDGRFLFYLTMSQPFRRLGEATMYGAGGQKRIPDTFIKDFRPAIPAEVNEQRAIAAFLDRETARIDALIAKKEHVIELLREQRTATISKLVTGGLDAAAPRRPSTVAWIGTIPAHWEVWRLKHCCKLETGHTPNRATAEYWVPEECTIPWVSLNDSKQLARVDVIEETAFCISPHGMANSSAHLLPAGAVAFTRDATIGLAAILGKPMAVSQHVIAWVCGPKMYNWYVLYAMYAMRPALEEFTAGSTLRTIGMPDVNRLACPVPPLDEQKAIVARIKAELLGIDSLLGRQEATLRLLREQRQALITAAVTGQIDVRGEVVLPEAS